MKIYVCAKSKKNLDDITLVTDDYEDIKVQVTNGLIRCKTFYIKDRIKMCTETTESLTYTVEHLRQMNDELSAENYRLRETIVQMAMEAHGK